MLKFGLIITQDLSFNMFVKTTPLNASRVSHIAGSQLRTVSAALNVIAWLKNASDCYWMKSAITREASLANRQTCMATVELCKYLISVRQVLESEKCIRLRSLAKFNNASCHNKLLIPTLFP